MKKIIGITILSIVAFLLMWSLAETGIGWQHSILIFLLSAVVTAIIVFALKLID